MHKTPGVLLPQYFYFKLLKMKYSHLFFYYYFFFYFISLGQKKNTLALRPLFLFIISNYKNVTTTCCEITSNKYTVRCDKLVLKRDSSDCQ